MQLNSDNILVQDRHVWYLLCGDRVRSVKVFDKLGGAKNVLQIVRACKPCEVLIRIPPWIISVLGQELLDLCLGERSPVLVIRAALLACFTTDSFAEKPESAS